MTIKAGNCKPVVKWVGGKRQLLDELTSRMPNEHIKQYVEPFVGGGALYFQVAHHFDSSAISDTNPELINLYQVIKQEPNSLINELLSSTYRNNKETYLKVRAWDREPDFHKRDRVERAARFLYMNKTGFNGLCRVNKSGQSNVPYGNNPKVKYPDLDGIMAAHAQLQNAHITVRDFRCVQFDFPTGEEHNAFVYFDPPYVPLTESANFTSYTSEGFGYEEQVTLRNVCDHLTKVGVRWMLSNSYTPIVLDLYQNYNIEKVEARRSINRDGAKRGKVGEAIIRNYE